MIVDHIESLRNKPVVQKKDRLSLESCLREPLPERSVDIGTVLRQVQQDILSNITHNDHPRYFGGDILSELFFPRRAVQREVVHVLQAFLSRIGSLSSAQLFGHMARKEA